MMRECTDLFLRYREVARLIWNLGFWPNPDLREWEAANLYQEVAARMFEGMVLLPVGCENRLKDRYDLGSGTDFRVEITAPGAKLLVNKNPPDFPAKHWGSPKIYATPGKQQLRFKRFFDWNRLGPIDLALLEVEIERCDENPALVGHDGLVEFWKCAIWLVADEEEPA
ncbi:hypothetical protein [Paludibaculum fermentans]|uniref:hypothetical protein n=1 Tax=Paludibaculum fermentans TaxID=1473598 RepID=UPI003EB96FF9